MSNIVFIATRIDGFISAPDGNLDWLDYVPFPEGEDGGYADFINRVDAIVLGRITLRQSSDSVTAGTTRSREAFLARR